MVVVSRGNLDTPLMMELVSQSANIMEQENFEFVSEECLSDDVFAFF